MPRFYCPAPLASGAPLELPAGAARHVQVLRLQPGDSITLFNGSGDPTAAWHGAAPSGGELEATITIARASGSGHASQRAHGLVGRKSH